MDFDGLQFYDDNNNVVKLVVVGVEALGGEVVQALEVRVPGGPRHGLYNHMS